MSVRPGTIQVMDHRPMFTTIHEMISAGAASRENKSGIANFCAPWRCSWLASSPSPRGRSRRNLSAICYTYRHALARCEPREFRFELKIFLHSLSEEVALEPLGRQHDRSKF